jgi:hypothetical protein
LKAQGSGIFDWRRTFQDLSPAVDFEEAYAEARYGNLDLRLGKQRIAWGKLDRFSPIDLINSLSYNDPFVLEESERRNRIACNLSFVLTCRKTGRFPQRVGSR